MVRISVPVHGEATLKRGLQRHLMKLGGSSVNLLTSSNTVLLDGKRTWKHLEGKLDVSYGFTVSDTNTSDNYEAFCTAIDGLAADVGLCVDQVDRALFSEGENRPRRRTWRQYVEAQSETLLCMKG